MVHPQGTADLLLVSRRGGSPLDRALVALAREPEQGLELEAALGAAPADLARHAQDHGVAGVGHLHARHLVHQFPELVAALDLIRRQGWSDHLTKLADLRTVAEVLAPLAGRWAAVKGPVLAERSYGRADARSYYDLDVLVHPAAFGAAMQLLEESGAELLDRNWALIRASGRAELSYRVNGRTPLDLHWHLVNEAPLRRRTTWDMSALLERATVADVGGVSVPVLADVDALVHVATHACLSGGHRLVWLKDVEQQQLAFPVASAEVERVAREARLWPAVQLALLRSARTFGRPELWEPTAWSRFNDRAGTLGFRTGGGWAGDGRVLGAATRHSAAASLSAVVGTVLTDQALPWGREHRMARWLPPAPPLLEELQRPGGNAADRAAYLAPLAAAA